ncbi:MAG TPA: R3H domain-containing nucleic acid-binding protein [Patescibacteria group bacterium]|nr:R3H domain-containing nucleic acid-binding protein [Patescibacteria group bacterium]
MATEKVQKLIENVLSLLELREDQFTVEMAEDDSVRVHIQLPEEETGIYIGHHGEGLTALQLLLSLMISQRTGKWYRVSVNINDYQERREDSLKNLAESAAEKAISLNQEVVLGNLSSYERRIVHLHLEQHGGVTTESRGEPPLRQLLVIPKAK